MEIDNRNAVYGEMFNDAVSQMRLIEEAIMQRRLIPFDSDKECEQWANEQLLDIVVYSKASKVFYNVSHLGELLTSAAYEDMYGDIMLIKYEDKKGEEKAYRWKPAGFRYHNRTTGRIIGEQSDGIRQPLSHRDFFTPTGHYARETKTFNRAVPFPVAAKETGRDTAHIYQYIQSVAGVCTPYLLAWLRAKMINPKQKTEIVPIFTSRAQGTGKSTFANVICRGLFGTQNVVTSEQYDAAARFNADVAEALVISIEEKDGTTDKRNAVDTIKSRATSPTIRKEQKGIDPVYQEDYSEYIITTNKDVPVKFEGQEDQRRFMVMEADPNFKRGVSTLADEVFTKLYGAASVNGPRTGVPFVEDLPLIAQFKHELYTDEEIAKIDLRKFPHTDAYKRCFTLPRTNESTEIDSIIRSLVPFINASLEAGKLVTELPNATGGIRRLDSLVPTIHALEYIPSVRGYMPYVALCRPIIFSDMQTGRPFAHATTERGLLDSQAFLTECGLTLLGDTAPLIGGFRNLNNRHRDAPAARIGPSDWKIEAKRYYDADPKKLRTAVPDFVKREGERLRVNGRWRPDPNGEFETVNEMEIGTVTLENKSQHVRYMDTFLFEADDVDKHVQALEQQRIDTGIDLITVEVYKERLALQLSEAKRLFNAGIAARIVYSGNKSYHILVRVKDSPTTLAEYKWLHAYLCTQLSDKVHFDSSTADPARLTRAPIRINRVSLLPNSKVIEGTQELIHEQWNHIYDVKWRLLYEQWLNRPLADYESTFKRRLRPTKPEYKDAMYALLSGTFWTDKLWQGRRQQCFFPAYRLCRILGYDHDTLWGANGILDGLNGYYKQNEVSYWRAREGSSIIKAIDDDVTRQIEEEEREADKQN